VFGDCSTAAETDRTHVDFVIIIIAFGGVLTVLLVTLCAFGTRRLVRHYKMLRQTEIAAQQQKLRRLKDAVNVMQKLRFPFTVMRFSTFKMRGKLVNHESARNDGSLLMLDTWSEAVAFAKSNPVVFHSHQWLGFRMPDPWNIHYSSMVRVGELLCREHGHTEDELFFWVDFHSIPQACLDSKLGAIASIAVYACCARYFAVVAPDAVHADLKETCNAASYARRGWCRLEQWAFMGVCGVEHMYLLKDAQQETLLSLSEMEGWLESSTYVFEADFTVEEDKHTLVDVILGLYGFMLICFHDDTENNNDIVSETGTHRRRSFTGSQSATSLATQKLIQQNRSRVFPEKYVQGLDILLEDQLKQARTGVEEVGGAFSANDFDRILKACQAFSIIQGRNLTEALGKLLSSSSMDKEADISLEYSGIAIVSSS